MKVMLQIEMRWQSIEESVFVWILLPSDNSWIPFCNFISLPMFVSEKEFALVHCTCSRFLVCCRCMRVFYSQSLQLKSISSIENICYKNNSNDFKSESVMTALSCKNSFRQLLSIDLIDIKRRETITEAFHEIYCHHKMCRCESNFCCRFDLLLFI